MALKYHNHSPNSIGHRYNPRAPSSLLLIFLLCKEQIIVQTMGTCSCPKARSAQSACILPFCTQHKDTMSSPQNTGLSLVGVNSTIYQICK